MKNNLLITGGAGFIGSNFLKYICENHIDEFDKITILDKLTYAGSLNHIESLLKGKIDFYHGDICDPNLISIIMKKHTINMVVNFAAESHVDRSIEDANAFIQTNVFGVTNIMDVSKKIWKGNPSISGRFLQISTDEVYGSSSLSSGESFLESSPLNPQNPYAATKASAEMMICSYMNTFDYPALIVRSSNNYGTNQNQEKLIPKIIQALKNNQPIKLYAQGENQRNWLHVQDNCHGIYLALTKGSLYNQYNISGEQSISNNTIAKLLIKIYNQHSDALYTNQIEYIKDRPGHDLCYKINDSKIRNGLGYEARYPLEKGLTELLKSYIL